MIKKRLLLGLIASLAMVGIEASRVPQLRVNATENDPWVWVSMPEDQGISSVLYYTEYGGNRCPAYQYQFDPELVHPWAIKEYLNETLKISAIVQTKQNQTFAQTFSLRSLGSKVQAERVTRNSRRRASNNDKPRSAISDKGRLIFSESFSDPKNPFKKWSHVVQSQLQAPHYEGVAFVNDRANSFVKNNMLYLKVTKSNYSKANPFHLKDCTSKAHYRNLRCGNKKYAPLFVKSIPPFVSAKLRSIDTFKYCRIQIKAKMPIGDLLFPGLNLAYDDRDDNDDGDDAIRIAIVRGHNTLSDYAGNEIGGSRVFGGAIYINDKKTEIHEDMEYADSKRHFGNRFHTYTVIWKEKSIVFEVDNRRIAEITGKVAQALSQKERHIELFLTVGGEYNFPDSRIPNSIQKNYRNSDICRLAKNVKRAVENSTKWEQPVMVIKSIKVYSHDE